MENDKVVSINNVSKSFILPHEKKGSLKSIFAGMLKPSGKSTKQQALKNISFDINKGEFFGIVGRNGSGKSTLLKIIAGIYQPSQGTVKVNGKLVPFIELGVGFNPELTGRENVYLNGSILGFNTQEIDSNYKKIVEFAELENFMDQKLKNYSSGMQVRLAFACATMANADVLLIDEVLAVGDADFQRKCYDYFNKLKKLGKTVIFVSHDMGAVREYCDRVALIEKSTLLTLGLPEKVASEYTKLFLDNDALKIESDDNRRWGDGGATYLSASCSNNKSDNIKLAVTAKSNKEIKDANFGFVVKDTAGNNIMGTNTKIKKQKINLHKNQIIEIVWEFENIFSDGNYTVDIAIDYSHATHVADWWEDALAFSVKKEERVPYAISPNIELSLK